MSIHVEILRTLIERAEEHYTCNRGPRPSGALFAPAGNDKAFINGDVEPTIGSQSCKDVGCMIVDGHCVRNIHAEVDALLMAARHGWRTLGGAMYSINKPCYACTLACIKAGITTIYYAYAVYDEQRTQDVLEAAGVECVHVPL